MFHRVLMICVSASVLLTCAGRAQETQVRPLTQSEIGRAIAIEQRALPFVNLPIESRDIVGLTIPGLSDLSGFKTQSLQTKPSLPPPVLGNSQADVTLLGAPGHVSENMTRRAIVSRFDYLTGISVSTVVDLDANRVLDVDTSRDKPAPLSVAEFERAKTIASEANVAFRQALGTGKPETLDYNVLVLVDSKTTSPTYGHRLVLLSIEKPTSSPRLLVDLSKGVVLSVD